MRSTSSVSPCLSSRGRPTSKVRRSNRRNGGVSPQAATASTSFTYHRSTAVDFRDPWNHIREGEAKAIHKGYKCSIRAPWYAVPSVWIPAGFVFRQIYDFPRVVLNKAKATSTDTIHRLNCKANPERVIANTYTYMTAASAEIEGRSYGGGVLELEPTEAERLLVPAAPGEALPLDECDRLIRVGRLDEALSENSRLVLMREMGLSKIECGMLRDIWIKMRDRRFARRCSTRLPGVSESAIS